jgi:glycosyltransferase involved in cell wall biosynthesis
VIVGVVTTSYPRWPGDFVGAFVADRVAELVAAGHTVEVLAAGHADVAHHVGAGGAVTVTRLPARFGAGPPLFEGGAPEALERGGVGVFWAAARFVTGLAAAVRARGRRWDRIESHWLAPCALAATAAAPTVPHRAFAHSGDVALLARAPLGRTLARRLAASGAELVFASEALRRRFAALAGALLGTVDPREPPRDLFPRAAAVNRRTFAAVPPRPPPQPRVVSVGRLVPIKGYDLLLHACARAGAAEVTIVGDGPERDRLRTLGARLGVPLRLPGAVPRAEVSAWLRAADLYVQPSRVLPNGRSEGTPVATLEALAVGLPVVASDSGGLAELPARHPAVALFRAGDVAALAALIRGGEGSLLLPRL